MLGSGLGEELGCAEAAPEIKVACALNSKAKNKPIVNILIFNINLLAA